MFVRLEREHNERAWLAWHTAKLPLLKNFPRLQTMLAKKSRVEQTWQQQMAIMDLWVAATRHRAKLQDVKAK